MAPRRSLRAAPARLAAYMKVKAVGRTSFLFIATATLAIALGAVVHPPSTWSDIGGDFAVVAAATAILLVAGRFLGEPSGLLVPLGFILVVAYMRHHFGGASSGLSPLFLIPVVWVAMYRSRADSIIALLFLSLVFTLPIVIEGGSAYPTSDLRRGISLEIVAVMLVVLIRYARGSITSDPLTGLGNRRLWDQVMRQQVSRGIRKGEPFAVAMIDIDDLKRFNDEWGHAACDAFLAECARSWQQAIRPEDTLVRAGGDEFFLLLPDVADDESAKRVIQRLVEATPNEQTFSAGVAHWDGEETSSALMHRADAALYSAKDAGRNRMAISTKEPASPTVVVSPLDPAPAS